PGAHPDAGAKGAAAGLHLHHQQRVVQVREAAPEILREGRVLDEVRPRAVEAEGGLALPRRLQSESIGPEEPVAEGLLAQSARTAGEERDPRLTAVPAQRLSKVPEVEAPPGRGAVVHLVPAGAVAEAGVDQAQPGAARDGAHRPLDHHRTRAWTHLLVGGELV